MLPIFGRILWRVEVAKSMRLGLYDLDIILGLGVQRVTLRCDAVSVQLSPLFIGVPIQFVNLQD